MNHMLPSVLSATHSGLKVKLFLTTGCVIYLSIHISLPFDYANAEIFVTDDVILLSLMAFSFFV